MILPKKLYKSHSALRKTGDKVEFEGKRQIVRGTVKKVKPDGTRVIKLNTHKIVKKKKEELK